MADRGTSADGGAGVPVAGAGVPAVEPRHLVPTPREAALGERAPASPHPTLRSGGGQGVWPAVRAALRDLDPRAIGGPKLPLLVLGLAALLGEWDDVALGVLLPEMRREFAFSLQFLLTIATAMEYVRIVAGPPVGYLIDRVRRVWVLRVGALVQNAGSVVMATAAGVPQLVGGRLMGSLGMAASRPATFPLLADLYPVRSRARVVSLVGVAGGLGAVVGPLVAGVLGDRFGWRWAVGALGVVATLVSLGFFLLREPVRGYMDRLELGAPEEVARTEQPPVSWAEAWRAARGITTLRRLWYAAPFQQAARVGILTFLPLYYTQEFGLSPGARGLLLALTQGAGLAGLLVAGPVADRLLAVRPGRVMTLAGLSLYANAASVLLLVLSPSPWLSAVVGLPLGFGVVVILPAFFTLVSLVVPARVRGLGLQTLAPWQLAGLLVLPFVGTAADAWGMRPALALFVPLFAAAGLVLAGSSGGVERDIRNALAASVAEEEASRSREGGRPKLLVCRGVTVHYDGVQVLFGVDLDVEEGEVVALLGTNGSGKSSLLRAIAGIQEASGGAIFFDGQDITHAPPHENAARGVVMVPGGNAVFPTLTVAENLRLAAWLRRDDEPLARQGVEEVLGLFPVLRDRLQQRAGDLSGGEQHMLGLAQAFLLRPRLLMVDELSLGLAPAVVEQLVAVLRRIRDRGTTVVVAEQSLNLALELAGRAVYLQRGEVRFDGPVGELLGRPDLLRPVAPGSAARSTPLAPRPQRAPAGTPLLRAEDVHVAFGGVRALAGASVEAAAGEVVGIIGPNGAGKTTLFDAISGFVVPQRGRVMLNATDVTGLGPDARARLGLGRSFQHVRLFPSLTVRENIAVAMERHLGPRSPVLAALWAPRVRRAERRVARRVDALVELLGLGADADRFPGELSTGRRRVVEMACVMAAEPSVLLLDEPSSGLAQAEAEELGPLLTRLVRETGCAMLIVEHDVPLVSSIADRLVAMELGRVLATGPPDAVLRDPRVVSSSVGVWGAAVRRSGPGAARAFVGAGNGKRASRKER